MALARARTMRQVSHGREDSMNPESPDAAPTVLDHVGWFFMGLSPAWMLIVVLILLTLALWLAWKGWPHHRIVEAIKTAPAATSSSGPSGLVKVSGQAQPGPPYAGS